MSIVNGRGRYAAKLKVDDRLRPGLAATTKGWWRQGMNRTVREQDSDMGRGAVYHDNVVRIVADEDVAAGEQVVEQGS